MKTLNIIFAVIILSINISAGELTEILSEIKNKEQNQESKVKLIKLVNQNQEFLKNVILEINKEEESLNYKCNLIDVLSQSNNLNAQKYMVELLKNKNEDIRICATKYIGKSKNEYAIEDLSQNVEDLFNSVSRGSEEVNLKKKILAINSIWALGEIGDSKVIKKLEDFYNKSDEVLRINIIFSMGKIKNNKVLLYLNKIAQNEVESDIVRSAAFEMIEEVKKGGK